MQSTHVSLVLLVVVVISHVLLQTASKVAHAMPLIFPGIATALPGGLCHAAEHPISLGIYPCQQSPRQLISSTCVHCKTTGRSQDAARPPLLFAIFRKFCRACSRVSMSAISEVASSNICGGGLGCGRVGAGPEAADASRQACAGCHWSWQGRSRSGHTQAMLRPHSGRAQATLRPKAATRSLQPELCNCARRGERLAAHQPMHPASPPMSQHMHMPTPGKAAVPWQAYLSETLAESLRGILT